VIPSHLVKVGLLTADNKYKTTILNGLKKAPTSSIDTFEKVEAQIQLEISKIEARSKRFTDFMDKN
jgi:hypothetical protein